MLSPLMRLVTRQEFDDERLGADGSAAHRPHQLNAALETRGALLGPDREVRVGGQRKLRRLHREPHLDAAVLGDAAGGDAIRIALAGDDEGAVAFDRPRQ